jgi:hypothetical protein
MLINALKLLEYMIITRRCVMLICFIFFILQEEAERHFPAIEKFQSLRNEVTSIQMANEGGKDVLIR